MYMIFYGIGNRGKHCGHPIIPVSEIDKESTNVVITIENFKMETDV